MTASQTTLVFNCDVQLIVLLTSVLLPIVPVVVVHLLLSLVKWSNCLCLLQSLFFWSKPAYLLSFLSHFISCSFVNSFFYNTLLR